LKKTAMAVSVLLLAVSMVLPVMRSVNLSAGKSGKCVTIDRTLTADGWPQPPLPPTSAQTLVADGWPQPPLPPQPVQMLFIV
jgi:hypothetical protein